MNKAWVFPSKALTMIGILMSSAALVFAAAFSVAAEPPPVMFAFQPNTPALGQGVIRVTGIGLSGRAYGPAGQLHLMAERAAVVDGYRKLALALGQGAETAVDRSRYVTASGYIVGAQIVQTRYYPGGRVEVDMTLPVQHGSGAHAIMPPPPPAEAAPQKVEKQKRQISEEEWLKIYQQKNR